MTDILDPNYESDLTEEEHAVAPPLSPIAKAILSAYWDDAPLKTGARGGLAAALHVIADLVRMDQPLGDTNADAGVFAAHQWIHGYIAAIADELESL